MSKASRLAGRSARRSGRGRLIGVGVALLATVLIGSAWLLSSPAAPPSTANVKGSAAAVVEIEEWGDFG
jgi:hypothetical protein